jgi:hypothetical protein
MPHLFLVDALNRKSGNLNMSLTDYLIDNFHVSSSAFLLLRTQLFRCSFYFMSRNLSDIVKITSSYPIFYIFGINTLGIRTIDRQQLIADN